MTYRVRRFYWRDGDTIVLPGLRIVAVLSSVYGAWVPNEEPCYSVTAIVEETGP